ncbi:hypothetical protein DFJ58DRAFT_740692 [Suillus subalutaceus]|uniref:uncharacterized protein n=1 Tax=Suillus subalutaceus TaxID=48586 RepID=UPI001B85B680|nr:uncharacterized protein DFJ58DRAFT_740692 [Suillus subalutaceus]KAG1876414.1 hypothetical protein DFJ58DRAFT_740692 [Suillus subalutaceus]
MAAKVSRSRTVLDLRTDPFAHCQLYTAALSRVKSRRDTLCFSSGANGEKDNIVYKHVCFCSLGSVRFKPSPLAPKVSSIDKHIGENSQSTSSPSSSASKDILDSFSSSTAYEVQRETKLTNALDNLAGSPFVSFKSRVETAPFKLPVKGEDAGAWMKPVVGVLQRHATPSPFGRGEETVMDPTYRRGTELKADELAFSLQGDETSQYELFVDYIQDELRTSMFVGKSVTLKLYKLAIYGEGGHFDWHRDSTHSDAHHGTVLVGVETIVNMHPTKSVDKLRPVVVAFYTDTEHKVMPVTKDTTGAPKLVQAVVDEIRELHEEGTTVVAFPLTHLYRKASVKKEYLKGTDSTLFDVLENHFNVVLHPVLIRAIEDGHDCDSQELFFAHKYKSSEENEEEPSHAKGRRGGVFKNASFHLPQASAILQLSLPTGVHLCNEAEISGEARYYGAGMFVEPKNEE